jgi:hypothetical protein
VLYRLGACRGPPVRQRRPAVRAPAEAGYHDRISAVTLPSPRPSHLYKCRAFSPPHADLAAPSRHPRRRHRAALPPASYDRATTHVPFLDPIGPSRATRCPGGAPSPPKPSRCGRHYRSSPRANAGTFSTPTPATPRP